MNSRTQGTRKDIISYLFKCGYEYKGILDILQTYYDVHISLRTLHRLLREYGLRRKLVGNSTANMIESVSKEIQGVGVNRGYRSIYQNLIEQGIQIPVRMVRLTMKELDPSGVERRSKRVLRRRVYTTNGPNDVWHIDGNDKLKPFGFSIHGAIDGFSRKILWLEVSETNKDPTIIAHYFANTVKSLQIIPKLVRGDRGTENVNVCGIQRFLRRNGTDSFSGQNSFKYGKSMSNQRIEQWWSYLKRSTTLSWIEFFKELMEQDLFDNTNNIHNEALKFCFFSLIQSDLEKLKNSWNHHKIRNSRNTSSPSGRPDLLYFLPNNYGAVNCGKQLTLNELELAI